MKLGVIGLGKMGQAIASRVIRAGHEVIGFDPYISKDQALGVSVVSSLSELSHYVQIFWLMVQAGKTIDETIETLLPHISENSIIIDGGNSHFKDSIRRYNYLKEKKIFFLDCGTSGGLHGNENGFSLMLGGDQIAFEQALPILTAIAAPHGVQLFGPAGVGHYIKMIHNGIEYALLQAYGEGFELLKNGNYKNLNLALIADTWNHGSIIRSWLLSLSGEILKSDSSLESISGYIGENKTGQWAVQVAQENNISLKIIEKALEIRAWSRETGGDYSTKFVAMLRNKFGGHEVKKL